MPEFFQVLRVAFGDCLFELLEMRRYHIDVVDVGIDDSAVVGVYLGDRVDVAAESVEGFAPVLGRVLG